MPLSYIQKMDAYHSGKTNANDMVYLIHTSENMGRRQTADSLAQDYISNFLPLKTNADFFSPDNLTIFLTYNRQINTPAFRRFWKKKEKVDDWIHQNGRTQKYIEGLITGDEIDRYLRQQTAAKKSIDWKALDRRLSGKYGKSYTARPMLDARIGYYKGLKDSVLVSALLVNKMQRFGFDIDGLNVFLSNNDIYNYIFKFCSNPKALLEAARWLKKMMAALPDDAVNLMDTYANLLYKAGNKEEAIEAEGKAASLQPKDTGIRDNWENMKNGKPTW